ncbi:MAG: stage II sporulation protein M [Armatimonadetes bacterium]|nr:stage II sporulation protein M [Armatimonadota bacterium]
MNEEAILRNRVDGWHRLGELSDKADLGFKRLTGEETVEFVRLYRKASADLSFLATQTSNAEVVSYLNGIVARAYGLLYRAPTRPFAEWAAEGVRSGAQTFRKNAWAFFLAFALFFGSNGVGYAIGRYRPDVRSEIVSPDMEHNFDAWKQGKFERRAGGENMAMTAFYASNNPRAGVLANALGVASFGVLTAYQLFMNGVTTGILAADMASVGKLGFLVSSIMPHGVSEIGGFLVTSAAGFVMARSMLAPGRQKRTESIRSAGKEAVVLLLTGTTMIVCAAPIEGFFSFNPAVPQAVKVAFAVVALLGWTAYFVGFARDDRQASSQKSA